MRFTNVAVFMVCVACMWFTATLVLRSWLLAVVAVLPLVLSPVFAKDISYVLSSGDGFLAAGLAACLAAWTWLHLRGLGASRGAIAVMSLLAGLTTSAKHPGMLMVVAYAAYLAWYSRGWARLVNPLITCVLSLAVFTAVNPVVLLAPGATPWATLWWMMERRAAVVAERTGRLGLLYGTDIFKFFWWPVLPAGVVVLWASRREKWFPVVGIWGLTLIAGMLAGVMALPLLTAKYLAPLDMAVFFPTVLGMLALARRVEARAAPPAGAACGELTRPARTA